MIFSARTHAVIVQEIPAWPVGTEGRYPPEAKKTKRVVSRQPNLFLTLKSNTMKNTVQKYCYFLICANILA